MKSIDKRLFIKLFIAFIVATVIGTLSHELGHFIVARYFGYAARINYAATYWIPVKTGEIVTAEKYFYISLGGPLQTILTGTVGLILLTLLHKKYFLSQKLNWKQWAIIFVSLFWLRQIANFMVWITAFLFTGRYSIHGDEIQLASYLQLPFWSIAALTAFFGLIVSTTVTFKFVPAKERRTFLTAGFTGGVTGYILWIELIGPYIMP